MQQRAPRSGWYAITILSLTVLCAVIDRRVLMLLAQPLKAPLDLNDTQIGSLQRLGAALLAAVAVVPLGWLADRITTSAMALEGYLGLRDNARSHWITCQSATEKRKFR